MKYVQRLKRPPIIEMDTAEYVFTIPDSHRGPGNYATLLDRQLIGIRADARLLGNMYLGKVQRWQGDSSFQCTPFAAIAEADRNKCCAK